MAMAGMAYGALQAERTPEKMLKPLIVGLVIVILITGYREAMIATRDAFWELREEVAQKNSASFHSLFRAEFSEKPSAFNIADYLCYCFSACFQAIGSFGVKAIGWLQDFAMAGLIVVSPLGLGFLALPWTKQIGINFILTSVGVALWALGVAVVDVIIYKLTADILQACGLTGAVNLGTANTVIQVATVGWALIAAGLLLGAIIVNAMYLSVPFVVAAIMRGAGPATTALQAGVQGLGAAIGLAMAAKSLGGAAAVGGAAGAVQGLGGAAQGAQALTNKAPSSGPPPPPIDSPQSGGGSSAQTQGGGGGGQASGAKSSSGSPTASAGGTGTPSPATSGSPSVASIENSGGGSPTPSAPMDDGAEARKRIKMQLDDMDRYYKKS
ncbi:MAG: hypothetical protein SFY92_00700 [Verrucomicrobiae bacterium]|nr:hypothetical protein [Verrucomicrobiae bacterium]